MVKRKVVRAGMIALAALVLIGLALGATIYTKNRDSLNTGSEGLKWEAVSWRVHLLARKAEGQVPELSWSELWLMMRTRGGFGLADAIRMGMSLDGAVKNPLRIINPAEKCFANAAPLVTEPKARAITRLH